MMNSNEEEDILITHEVLNLTSKDKSESQRQHKAIVRSHNDRYIFASCVLLVKMYFEIFLKLVFDNVARMFRYSNEEYGFTEILVISKFLLCDVCRQKLTSFIQQYSEPNDVF